MRLRQVSIIYLVYLGALVGWSRGDETIARQSSEIPVEDAVAVAKQHCDPFASMFGDEPQVFVRLAALRAHGYVFEKGHAPAWEPLMRDREDDICARLCAAYFLFDSSDEARRFVEARTSDGDLLVRFNAAEAVLMYVKGDPHRKWGIDLLIRLLDNGAIDSPAFVRSESEKQHGHATVLKHSRSPLANICRTLGFRKERSAVAALVKTIERGQCRSAACFALGEIGDPRAGPILMGLWGKDDAHLDVIAALGRLRYMPALSLLITSLGKLEYGHSRPDYTEDICLLESLQAMGDERAIEPIVRLLQRNPPGDVRIVAEQALGHLRRIEKN